jgi:hypothetical protein
LYAWDFEKDGRELRKRVEGQRVFNSIALRLYAALAELSLVYLPENQVLDYPADGRLVRALDAGARPFQAITSTTQADGNIRPPSPRSLCASLRGGHTTPVKAKPWSALMAERRICGRAWGGVRALDRRIGVEWRFGGTEGLELCRRDRIRRDRGAPRRRALPVEVGSTQRVVD